MQWQLLLLKKTSNFYIFRDKKEMYIWEGLTRNFWQENREKKNQIKLAKVQAEADRNRNRTEALNVVKVAVKRHWAKLCNKCGIRVKYA